MAERGTYRRIAAELERRVREGDLPVGSAFPSEADLVAEFGVARETVRQALRLLADKGLVEVVQGRRRFVRDPDGRASREPEAGYELVASQLRRRIEAGAYPDGALPGELQLAAQFKVSRGTIRRAIALLVDQGLLMVQRGVGTYVAAGRSG